MLSAKDVQRIDWIPMGHGPGRHRVQKKLLSEQERKHQVGLGKLLVKQRESQKLLQQVKRIRSVNEHYGVTKTPSPTSQKPQRLARLTKLASGVRRFGR